MESVELPDDTALAFTVPQSRLHQLLQLFTREPLQWDLAPRFQTPDATEIDDDEEAPLSLFELKANPRNHPRLKYIRKRARLGDHRLTPIPSAKVNRGYVFGSEEDCDVRLPDRASGIHCRIYLNKYRVWMVYDESSNGTYVNSDAIKSARAQKHHGLDKLRDFKDQVALHPAVVNTLRIGDLELQIWVNHDSDRFTEGRSEIMIIPDDDELSAPSKSIPTRSPAATFLDPNRPLPKYERPMRKEYHMLDQDRPPSRGETRRMIHKATGTRVVGKLYRRLHEEETARKRYETLATILRMHEHLLAFRDGNETDLVNCYLILTDHLDAFTLQAHLSMRDPLGKEHLVIMFIQMMSALRFLHSKEIIHRDVRPSTILWNQNTSRGATLTGFSEFYQGVIASDVVGDEEFRAPEVGKGKAYDAKVDVYSLCAIVSSHPAPEDPFDKEFIPEEFDMEVQSLLACGSVHDPKERYSSSQMCETIHDLSGNETGPPFTHFTSQMMFELRCVYGNFGTGFDFYIREADLWRAVSWCSSTTKREYEHEAQRNNSAWPFYVPFKLARRFLPDADELDDDEDEHSFRFQRVKFLTRNYAQSFKIYYHKLSKMLNLTQLLAVTGLSLDSLTFAPSTIQEVYGNPDFQGTYIDCKAFRSVWDQMNCILRSERCSLDTINLDYALSAALQAGRDSAHRHRFLSTNYNKYVIVFAGWRMILVRREDGNANLYQVQNVDSAWQNSVIYSFVPSSEAAELCDQQGLIETAATLRNLNAKPNLNTLLVNRRKPKRIVFPHEMRDINGTLARTDKVAGWLQDTPIRHRKD